MILVSIWSSEFRVTLAHIHVTRLGSCPLPHSPPSGPTASLSCVSHHPLLLFLLSPFRPYSLLKLPFLFQIIYTYLLSYIHMHVYREFPNRRGNKSICSFWVWFILPRSDIQIHSFPENIRISFSSLAEWNSLVQWTMFLRSSVDGPLGWPRILAVTSSAAVKCLAVLDERFSLGFDTIQILPESSFYLPASKGASFRRSPDPAHWLSFSIGLAEP